MPSFQDMARVLFIGIVATLVLDLWLVLLRSLGIPTLNFALIGRWVGHLWRGRFVHPAIVRSEPIPGELAWGWFTHYAIGIAFAAVLVSVLGTAWLQQPRLAPALVFGLCTVLAPLFVMQPAMGAGFASSRTATPARNAFRSVANHGVFGLALYLASRLATQVMA